MKNHHRLLLSLVLGACAGLICHGFADNDALQIFNQYLMGPIGQIFLRLIFMIVVPMVMSGLMLGVYQLSNHHGLARVAQRTLFFTLLASSASVAVGISLVNLAQPGVGLDISQMLGDNGGVNKIQQNVAQAKPVVQSLLEIIPKNPFASATQALEGEMLSLMFFSLAFGAALAATIGDKPSRWVELLEETYAACLLVVDTAMKLAPIAVFALVFQSTFKFGHHILFSLGFYVLVVVTGLLLQQVVVYSMLLRFFTRIKPLSFFRQCRDVYLYAFATASSNATLPRSLELAEQELKLRPEVARFVLTIGSTANQNGTALFEGITVLFLAQVYGVDLSLAQQVQIVLMSILAGIGTAGVPGGSLPLIMILTQQVGIPPEGMGLILGVDRFLDMCRTTLNVSGDLVIAALVDEPEPERA
ncbi:dicarboxylate/amino acid:cation symporter [Methylomonas rosea]|uniref:Dicarboxylate/amino acid:cation symporter n=1 Tax=Methylomonas rosea TaxID=2952227 RepID=A0ABT1TNC7_9GAMM|nr:dicarboxylate/amino acid:cation symporter [Methylomonas sp. WSC-7]MCQ8116274.1 dicarboxylate/amino acid:cation symporter [Methylomonas sp. WSC-7]